MKTDEKPGPRGPGLVSRGLFSIITLGCKSNQYDSAALAASLAEAGWEATGPDSAQVVVVNTCMVTGPTEAQCRKAIRRAKRRNPGAKIVVAGCMSRGARKDLEALNEVDLILDPAEKGRLTNLLGIGNGADWIDWPDDAAVELGGRDRGFLKVQDGCDAVCTYCVVPSVRGRSRSLGPERILDAVEKLMARGAGEVVLSGIHLGQYGKGLTGGWDLESLLDLLLQAPLPGRLRLSSLEPLEVTGRLLRIIAASDGRICRHLHIPLQSGSDGILAAMGRPYRREQFAEAVERARGAIPGVGIGCDVICGFPGESERQFEETAGLVGDLSLPFIHVFPYSARPGTAASLLKDDVPHHVKKERVAALTALVDENRTAYAGRFAGETVEVVIENRSDQMGRALALSDNYLRSLVETGGLVVAGSLVRVTVVEVRKDLLVARAVGGR